MTDEDKNLLELAARTAGFEAGWVLQGWNPITDDGDALRLAAKCKLTVCMDGDASVSAHTAYDPSICFVTQFIKHHECKHAATRRAIVRAAAEIGKAQQ